MKGFVATLVDTPELGNLRIRRDQLIVIDDKGYIEAICPASSAEAKPYLDQGGVQLLGKGSFLLPTFTDLHQHAPQYLYAGTGLDLPLLEWLEKYAYAAEESIDADPKLAERVYKRLAQRYKQLGTGCTVMFGSLKVESNLILAKVFQEAGVRAFVGKLSMDQSPRPTYNESSTAASLSALTTFLDSYEDYIAPLPEHERLVHPIITPRFVPTCSDDLLRGLAQVAEKRNVRVQSHMCEGRDQMDWVERTRGKKDEEVFDEMGLLRPRSIQAHVTYLSPSLMDLCKKRGVSIAHCPLSNVYFSEAQFPLREALDAKVSVGLGSDVAGGYSLSLETNMRSAVYTARMREGLAREERHQAASRAGGGRSPDEPHSGPGEGLRVSWDESLYVATRGGKKAVDMGGIFEVGMEFDAQLIELYNDNQAQGVGGLDFFIPPQDTQQWWLEAVEKWWCGGDERNRKGMWIQGNKVL